MRKLSTNARIRSSRPVVSFTIVAFLTLLASLQAPASAQQTSALVTLSGTVYDRLSGRPLTNALVQLTTSDLQGLVYSDRTNLLGDFRIPGVQPGEYIIGFTHPFLDSLGLDVPPMKLKVDGSTPLQLSLAIPTPRAVRAELCPGTESADSSGLMLGFLRDADTGSRLDSGTVVLEWTEVRVSDESKEIHAARRSASAHATSAGWYALCGVPTAGPVAAHATVGDRSSGYIDVRVPPGGVRHRDFLIPPHGAAVAVVDTGSNVRGDTLYRGRARLAVTVRDRNGKPLSGARLLIQESGIAGTTDDDGSFTLTGLPSGTRTLEVRHIGYAPTRAPVDLASDRTASTTITLDKIADVLSEVTVYGNESIASRRLAGFRQRMRLGFGHFVTRADIEKRAPLRLTDLIHGIPGVSVERSGTFDYKVVSSYRDNLCRDAVVYVDGHQLIKSSSGARGRGSPITAPSSAPAPRAGQAPGAPRGGTTAPASNDEPRSQVAGGQVSDSDFAPINDLVWLDDVVGVEVYSSGLFAPAEFGGSDTCPRVIVWTSPDAAALTRAGDGGDGR